MQVKILDKVLERLKSATKPSTGHLFGILLKEQNELHVLALQDTKSDLIYSLPFGIEECGKYEIADENQKIQTSGILIVKTTTELKTYNNGKELDFTTITQQDLFKEFIFVRCSGKIPIQCDYSEKAATELFLNIKDSLKSNSTLFKLCDSKILLTEQKVLGTESSLALNEFHENLQNIEEVNVKKKNQPIKQRFLHFEKLSRSNQEKKHAPICIVNKSVSKVINTYADIDTILMIPASTKITKLYPYLLGSVNRFLKLFENNLIHYINGENKDIVDNFKFETIHFLPVDCGHFITLLYLESCTEESLKGARLLLHQQLLLNMTSPQFRRANKYTFQSSENHNSILINPHEAVKLTDNGGEVALVRGKYEYYHYCQNNADDKGWGCAYRSLQTLASWFKLQGYVDKPVPSLRDIQKCLVDIKDKPANFLGSKQWIGSTEVSFVLSSLLGVESRILHVDSGQEMAQVGTDLVNHFERHGSPIMIGGGVLAHTILGVDYNRDTGNIKFLILDPHYTASEDLNVIISKGWCGWKGVNFWDKGAYYNMCLPQVPREI